MRNKIIKTLERNVDASATKQKQWLRAGLVWVAEPGHVTSKITKHAASLSFKLSNDFIEVRGFSPGTYSTSHFLLSVNSKHNN